MELFPFLLGDGGFLAGQVELIVRLRHLDRGLLDGELVVAGVNPKEQRALGEGPAGFEVGVLPHHNTRDLRHEVNLSVGTHRALSLNYDLDLLGRGSDGFDERAGIGAGDALGRLAH